MCFVAAAVAFLAAREANGGQASAAPAALEQGWPQYVAPQLPGRDERPKARTTPDTKRPFWGVPYRAEDAAKPRVDLQVEGIMVGPHVAVAPGSRWCEPGEAEWLPAEGADQSQLRIKPSYLPAGAVLDRARAIACKGVVVSVEHDYVIPAEEGFQDRVARGQLSWFEGRHGGAFSISKRLAEFPAYASGIAAERWSGGRVAGLPAALGRPILDEGFGDAAVVVWDDPLELVVSGTELRLAELRKIAEGVLR
jgi:hypothetical protein